MASTNKEIDFISPLKNSYRSIQQRLINSKSLYIVYIYLSIHINKKMRGSLIDAECTKI